MFTVKDICDVAAGRVPDLHNPSINSVTREFYKFDKSMGMSDVRAEEQSSTGFIKDVGVPDDDYSDFDEQYSNRDCETGFAMGDGEILDSINDEFDFGTMERMMIYYKITQKILPKILFQISVKHQMMLKK